MAAAWDGAGTPWRQGLALSRESSIALGLFAATDAESKLAIVISHDCDLPKDPKVEPEIEIIVATRPADANHGNFTQMKNPRRLRISYEISGERIWFELLATNKRAISKELLIGHMPDPNTALDKNARAVLRRWLGARYNRAAFPNEFEDRRKKHTSLAKNLGQFVEPLSDLLVGVHFDLDDGQETERNGQADLYGLHITLVYRGDDEDPEAALRAAEKAATEIAEMFRKECFVEDDWQWIRLHGCDVSSDEVWSVAAARRTMTWHFDYMSFPPSGDAGVLPA
jgi:hypothetical protein